MTGEALALPLVQARAPEVAGIDLRCCSVEALLGEVRGASLVVADPPRPYEGGVEGHGRADDHYDVLTVADIRRHVIAAWDCAADDAYLLLWSVWPFLMDPDPDTGWPIHGIPPWRGVTGGGWTKTGQINAGYHWRGHSEPVLVYRKGNPRPTATIRSSEVTEIIRAKQRHSEKPLPWARDHVRAFCPPDGLVFDLYAGMAPYARACAAEGRRYVGAEIDAQRHADAMGLLAGMVGVAR